MKNFYKILFATVFVFGVFVFNVDQVKAEGDCCLLKKNDITKLCLSNETERTNVRSDLIGCNRDVDNPDDVNEILSQWKFYFQIDYTTLEITSMKNVDCNATEACVEFSDQEKMFIGTISRSNFDLTNIATFNVKVSKLLPVTAYNFDKLECTNCSIIPGLKSTNGGFSVLNSNINVHELIINFELTPYEYIKVSQDKKLPATVNLEFKASGKTVDGNKDLTTFLKFPFVIKGANCKDFDNDERACSTNSGCLFVSATKKCGEAADASLCSVLNKNECATSIACTQDANEKCVSNVSKAVDEYISQDHQKPDGYTGPLPDCAFDGSCRDVNKLVELALKVVDYLFSIVAGLAFVFFIYGGFTWIFSFGNPEKVKKGQQIFVYAVIGLIIVFSAYILVSFLLNVLGVNDAYIIIN
ncbi:MAG: hypothetical protein A2493_02390 [Candidatus Magasanikbacteria bacterium RIFOXYC12_FULL_33_11]|uniref:Transmembrane protein n=1 Tax=Candidatus Magasanikbacteria bacterium RIFOXYC12_FULL_33_11 TaxID=1798701 RepID=A0A1F6NPJ6_9BACT|nr:MAG: hypothetical protein A2493_02390 [Candidatus Magasanikbacteria bacterium RIFOXYC12_FULL_33_11]